MLKNNLTRWKMVSCSSRSSDASTVMRIDLPIARGSIVILHGLFWIIMMLPPSSSLSFRFTASRRLMILPSCISSSVIQKTAVSGARSSCSSLSSFALYGTSSCDSSTEIPLRQDYRPESKTLSVPSESDSSPLMHLQQRLSKPLIEATLLLGLVTSMLILPCPTVRADDDTTTTAPLNINGGERASTSYVTAIAAKSSTGYTARRYWDIMDHGTAEERWLANERLVDHAVGTINTMFYDSSGGYHFQPPEFYQAWRMLRDASREEQQQQQQGFTASVTASADRIRNHLPAHSIDLTTRDGAVESLRWVVSNLGDPFSKYLTRDELRRELTQGSDGFLGLGGMVEVFDGPMPFRVVQETASSTSSPARTTDYRRSSSHGGGGGSSSSEFLSWTRAENLPMWTAVAPDSPAERAGLTVGDRIVAVGDYKFLGETRDDVTKALASKFTADNYAGYPDLTIAKPIWKIATRTASAMNDGASSPQDGVEKEIRQLEEPVVVGYRTSRVKLPTTSIAPFKAQGPVNGDAIVHYELLTKEDSIFDRFMTTSSTATNRNPNEGKVGYIRLTRFSRASTAGFVRAIDELEAAGAQSFIIDVRNNYGGIIQEAMLTASTLLRDPHSVLCYTMNSRGGFTPHDVEEYIVDKRFPGYLLSSEPRTASIDQVRRESPEMFEANGIAWVPPSSFASLHEQTVKRGITIGGGGGGVTPASASRGSLYTPWTLMNRPAKSLQKKLIVLINEGTASSAEVFASSLHDNGRTVALVGSKSFGKGLIQHTFPMPDGGGLRLTVAEYLTPALKHVTNVGSARYGDDGRWKGGGIQPDIYCDSQQGIPSDIGADLCVGVALDALEAADVQELRQQPTKGGLLSEFSSRKEQEIPRRFSSGLAPDTF